MVFLLVLIPVDTDTAEEVVNEMISESVLPSKYQHLITGEINRILREMTRPSASEDKNREEHMQRQSVTLPRNIDTEKIGEQKQWNSLSRISSDTERYKEVDGLSQKGSMGDMTDFEDFPTKGYYMYN